MTREVIAARSLSYQDAGDIDGPRINFTIRYRADIKPGMWVRFRGEKWDISTLGEYAFKRTYLGLKASLSKGVSG